MQNLNRALHKQLSLNKGKNLLHSQVEQLIKLDPAFLAAMEELVTNPSATLSDQHIDELAGNAADSLIERIYLINQYIQIDSKSRSLLASIYRESWRKLIESRDVESTLRNHHYSRLRAFVEGLLSRRTLN